MVNDGFAAIQNGEEVHMPTDQDLSDMVGRMGSGDGVVRKWERQLRTIPGVERVEHTNGQHVRLVLANGRFTVTSATTGDWRTLDNTPAQVRRVLRRQQWGTAWSS
jgi:hypothetical protein